MKGGKWTRPWINYRLTSFCTRLILGIRKAVLRVYPKHSVKWYERESWVLRHHLQTWIRSKVTRIKVVVVRRAIARKRETLHRANSNLKPFWSSQLSTEMTRSWERSQEAEKVKIWFCSCKIHKWAKWDK